MALPKNPKYDLKRKYNRTLEISFVLSILFVIGAFKFFPDYKANEIEVEEPPELVKVKDVEKTKQDALPPPPPKPVIPIEAPSDEILEDIIIEETIFDENENVLPPPKIDDKAEDEVPPPFVSVEEMPEPIGGLAGILKKLKYPELAIRANVQGRVIVQAIIGKEGNVESVELVKGIGMGCDEEAMRVVRDTKFKPGKQRGKPVRVYMTIPIVFKLQ